MRSASVRFYGALNDFLPAARKQTTLVCAFESSTSVKDLVEALGVPHPEIDLLVVNGQPVDFACLVHDEDRIAVYPSFTAFDLPDSARLGPAPQAQPRFVADVHLGRLTAYLRLAGIDAKYRNDYSDHEIATISADDDRTLLTRDVGVLKHRVVTRGYFVRETQPARQLVEVLRRFDLVTGAVPFSRCVRCNGVLQAVPKHRVEHLLEPRTREHYREFSQCPGCGHVYWRGSHHARMNRFLEMAFTAVARNAHGPRYTT